MAYAITVTASFTTATCCVFCNNLKEESAMVKWLIIGFLLVCFFIFAVEVGEAMDYDPSWDDVIDERDKEDEQQ